MYDIFRGDDVFCKLCNRHISHTFGSFFSSKNVHLSCEEFLRKQENIVVYPFLEGVIIVDYLVDFLIDKADKEYITREFMGKSIKRAIKENTLILFLENEVSRDALYLLFLLSNQRLYWVFLERPSFLE